MSWYDAIYPLLECSLNDMFDLCLANHIHERKHALRQIIWWVGTLNFTSRSICTIRLYDHTFKNGILNTILWSYYFWCVCVSTETERLSSEESVLQNNVLLCPQSEIWERKHPHTNTHTQSDQINYATRDLCIYGLLLWAVSGCCRWKDFAQCMCPRLEQLNMCGPGYW